MIRKIMMAVSTLAAVGLVLLPIPLRRKAIETSVFEIYAVKTVNTSVLGI